MTDDSSVSKTEESVKKKSLPFVDNFGDENQTIADYEAFMDEGEYDAKIYQTLDVTFLESVSKENPLGKIIKESKDPLIKATASGEVIDVEMMLEDLRSTRGVTYFSEVLNGETNDDDVTSLHIACFSDKKGYIVKALLETFRENSTLQLESILDRISDERTRSVSEVVATLSEDFGMTTKLDGRDPRIRAVDDWFDEANRRARRTHEFRQELWWTQCVSARDRQGRTPVHYAVLGGNMCALDALLSVGHGRFTDKRVAKYFDDSALYSTTSGHVVGAVSSHDAADRVLEELPSAEQTFNLRKASLSSASWELSRQGRANSTASKAGAYTSSLDFEVIVPWVLRNSLKRAQDLGARRNLDGVQQLRILAERACVDGSGKVLIASELRTLFKKLGIRLTADVIRELCRQYQGDAEDIKDKWERYVEQQEMESMRADAKDGSDARSRGRAGSRGGDSKAGAPAVAESKGGGKSSDCSDRSGNAKGSGDDRDDMERGSKDGDDSEPGVGESLGGAAVDITEEDLGLDVEKLLTAIESGTCLESLDLSDDTSLEGLVQKRRANQLFVPACVSLGSIVAARGAALDLTDHYGCTPLLYASKRGDIRMVDMLCDFGADVGVTSRDGLTALSVAADKSISMRLETALVEWLRASRDYTDTEAGTAHLLRSLGQEKDSSEREKQIAGLMQYFPGLQEQQWAYGMPPLSWAVVSCAPNVLRRMLSASTMNVAEGDLMGRTALHECVSLLSRFDNSGVGKNVGGALQMLEMLLGAGADANAQTVSGRAALHELFCRGQYDGASSSSHQGVKIYNTVSLQVQNKGAFERARVAATKLLVQWGADVLLPDREGNTPLHHAARMNEARSLIHLLKAVKPSKKTALGNIDEGVCTSIDVDSDAKSTDSSTATSKDKGSTGERGKHAVDEYVCNPQGRTCLHMACQAGASRAAHLLARWDAETPASSFANTQDKRLLRPYQLLPPSCSSACLQSAWTLARAGDANALGLYLTKLKESRRAAGGLSDDDEDAADERQEQDDRDRHLADERIVPVIDAWLDDGVDVKSRRLRWTPLHCVMVGWAEAKFAPTAPGGSGAAAKGRALGLTLSAPLARVSRDDGCTRMKNNQYPQLGNDKKAASDATSAAYKATLEVLLQNKAYCDPLDWQCRTPLMMAAAADLPTIALQLLVDAGADIDAKDLEGNSALHYAYAYGSMGASVWLEGRGASGTAKNNRREEPFELVGKMTKINPPVFATQRKSSRSSDESKGGDGDDDEAKY